jgi:hypothetical protein
MPPPPPTYVVKDKWDPYDSESDIPFIFQFEGETAMLSPATSLSSLASSHLVSHIQKARSTCLEPDSFGDQLVSQTFVTNEDSRTRSINILRQIYRIFVALGF